MQILIVDDEVQICALLKRGLEKYSDKLVVHTAYDGQTALDMLKSMRYDILVSDLRLPGMNGYELVSETLKLEYMLPAIIISGHGDSIPRNIEAASQIKTFIRKPFSLKLLFDTIETIV